MSGIFFVHDLGTMDITINLKLIALPYFVVKSVRMEKSSSGDGTHRDPSAPVNPLGLIEKEEYACRMINVEALT